MCCRLAWYNFPHDSAEHTASIFKDKNKPGKQPKKEDENLIDVSEERPDTMFRVRQPRKATRTIK
jgi:hypothetical protein